jgi:hypothetical protein
LDVLAAISDQTSRVGAVGARDEKIVTSEGSRVRDEAAVGRDAGSPVPVPPRAISGRMRVPSSFTK